MTAEEPALIVWERFDSSRYVYLYRILFHNDVFVAMFHVSVFAFFQLLSMSACVVHGPHDPFKSL